MNKLQLPNAGECARRLLAAVTVKIGTVFAIACSEGATEVDRWMERAEASAQRVSVKEDQFQVWQRVAELYAARGMPKKARSTIERISHGSDRTYGLVSLANTFARLGQTEDALDLALSLSEPAARDGALWRIAFACVGRHEFSRARELILKIGECDARRQAWSELVRAQASAGKYDEAIATLDQFPWTRYGLGAGDRAELIEFIAKARQSRERNPADGSKETIGQRIRGLGRSWEHPSTKDLPAFRERASWVCVKPTVRVSALFSLARWHANHDQDEIARKYLTRAARLVRDIDDRYNKALYGSLICGLALELGDMKQAAALRREVLTDEAVRNGLQRDDHCGVAPKAIAVLVQLGDMKAALLTASAVRGVRRYDAWWTLGVSFALEGGVKDVETKLQELDRPIEKALVCTGVAAGLHELESRRCPPRVMP